MEEKLKFLLDKWHTEQNNAQIKVKHFVEKYQYGEAQRHQTKSVWLEHCIEDIKALLEDESA